MGRTGPNGNGEYLEVAEALEYSRSASSTREGATPRRPRVQVERSRLFHVEFTHALESAMLGEPVAREMLAGAGVLRALAPVELGPLDAFRLAFRARYGERDVPLLDVLDEVTGIGFDAALASTTVPPPLLRGVEFPASPGTARGGRARSGWRSARGKRHGRAGAVARSRSRMPTWSRSVAIPTCRTRSPSWRPCTPRIRAAPIAAIIASTCGAWSGRRGPRSWAASAVPTPR